MEVETREHPDRQTQEPAPVPFKSRCSCPKEYGERHRTQASCDAFRFAIEVQETMAAEECDCCHRRFPASTMHFEKGDYSTGIWDLHLCPWCADPHGCNERH